MTLEKAKQLLDEVRKLHTPDVRKDDSLCIELRDTLECLVDLQNGCPLPKYEADWNATMEKANRLLGRIPHP